MATINPTTTEATATINVGADQSYVLVNTSDTTLDIIATPASAGGRFEWRSFESSDHTGNRFSHDNTGSGKLVMPAHSGLEIRLANTGTANSAATLSVNDRRDRHPGATVLVALRASVSGDDITP